MGAVFKEKCHRVCEGNGTVREGSAANRREYLLGGRVCEKGEGSSADENHSGGGAMP